MGQTSNTLSDLQRTSYISDQCSFPGPCAREHPEVEGEKESKEAGLHIAGKMEAAFAKSDASWSVGVDAVLYFADLPFPLSSTFTFAEMPIIPSSP